MKKPSNTDTMRETLRQIDALLESHPDLPVPYVSIYDHLPDKADLRWYLHINDKGDPAEQKRTAQTLLRTIGGTWDKGPRDHDGSFKFEQVRDGLSMEVVVTREAVCRRVVKGVETVTVPAKPAVPEQTVEREIVEWECEPVLATPGGRA